MFDNGTITLYPHKEGVLPQQTQSSAQVLRSLSMLASGPGLQ